MNCEIYIFPLQSLPCSLSWEDVIQDYYEALKKMALEELSKKEIYLLDDYYNIVMNTKDVRVAYPARIDVVSVGDDVDEELGRKKCMLRYSFSRSLEFLSGKVIYTNINSGMPGLYEIDENFLDISFMKNFPEKLTKKHKESINKLKYVIQLQTDLIKEVDPIFVLSIVLATYLDGLISIEHNDSSYPISPGYYTVEMLKTVLTSL